MTLTVEVALDLAANGQGEFFTLDDPVKGELDNGTYLLAGDVFVDMTDQVRSVRISRGRSSRLARFTSATGQVVFDNRDRFLDPSWGPRDTVQAMLRRATFFIDAHYADSSQTLRNLGTGGAALNATLGSSGSADSNDPKWLPFTGTAYCYLPGVAGNYLSVPDSAAVSITGDLTVYCRVALDDWTGSGIQALVTKFLTTGNQRTFEFRVQPTGTVELITSADGAAIITHTSTVAPSLTDGTAYWLAATIDVDNGAAGHDVRFFYAADSATVPSSWTQIGSTVTTAGTTSLFDSTTEVEVGATLGGGTRMAAGKVYRAIVASGIGATGVPGGTTVLDVDCSLLTSGASSSWVTTTGQTVTINRATSGRKSTVVVGNCWLFGTDDRMEVADSSLLDFGPTDDFTVLAVYRQWTTPVNFGYIVGKTDGATNQGYFLRNVGTSSSVYGLVGDSGGNNANNAASPATYTAGALASRGFIVDRTAQTIKTFNGTTYSTTASTSAVGSAANARKLVIGNTDGGGGYQDFELVAVAVFRRALTATEIGLVSTYFAGRSGTTDPDDYIDGTGSPYYGQIVPRKQIRITDDGTLVALVQAEDWNLDYSMSGDMLAVVALTDGLATLAKATIDETAVSSESSGDRVAVVLDAAAWPDGMRTLDAGRATLSAGTIDAGTNALTYLQKVEASEPGALFVAKDATLTFLDRGTLQAYTTGVTFGTGGIPFAEPFTTTYGTDDMVNRATVTYTGGTAVTDDATSQAAYGVIARSIDTLLDDADDADALANWTVSQGKDPVLRVKVITIKRGACTDAQWAQVLALELGSTALVEWTPGAVGDPVAQYVTVDGIAHDAAKAGTEHTVTLTLSETSAGFILDDSVFGVLDSSILAF